MDTATQLDAGMGSLEKSISDLEHSGLLLVFGHTANARMFVLIFKGFCCYRTFLQDSPLLLFYTNQL